MRAFATTVLSLCLAAGLATADSAGGPSSAQAAVPQFAEARDTYGAPTTTSAFGDGTFTSTGSFGSGGGSSFSKPITYSSGTLLLVDVIILRVYTYYFVRNMGRTSQSYSYYYS